MSQSDEDLDRVKKACTALGEHFDTVHIFVTRHEEGSEGGTVNVNWGSGNWFARRGQIQTWAVKQDEISRKEIHEDE